METKYKEGCGGVLWCNEKDFTTDAKHIADDVLLRVMSDDNLELKNWYVATNQIWSKISSSGGGSVDLKDYVKRGFIPEGAHFVEITKQNWNDAKTNGTIDSTAIYLMKETATSTDYCGMAIGSKELAVGVKRYTHTQSVSASTWVVNHNLNCKPSVTITDENDNEVWGVVKYINDNTINIILEEAHTGKVYCI